ncbi:16S rRNA (uracil(1498)-N(3))-methyltransferase [Pseudomaricurvus sp. HS19]|uniref:16S rRNA (uracil(1498)-N(3))-methyltransferase n=1 Tax=Pseudomaricurvus sp. HS19 TaxID=2692626 RepID=UPI001370E5CA|nr:16S rRNA (uracil(1498)-N(3))-methyltransferase [Pseudomaricurvus sp. HS19]MYM62550.1 16S rRNA (uracil(1498)-N(3))-methyltransferase [Pseudomaricurvus sp. HS19]
MNLLILHPTDFSDPQLPPDVVTLCDRRARHLLTVNGVTVGDQVRTGLLNGQVGEAEVVACDNTSVQLQVRLHSQPPPPLPLHLIVALPRPKMVKRILQTIATMGVKQLTFINSYRVEKSYWQSPWLQEHQIREQLLLGLEQGVDTLLPEVRLVKRFKPFVEDELPHLCKGRRALLAHPRNALPCPPAAQQDTLLVIGPEGGFIEYEVNKLTDAGCAPIHLGPRILRVETAVPVLLAKLFPI